MRTYTLGVGWKRIYTLGVGWKYYCGKIGGEGEVPKGQGDDERMKYPGFVWENPCLVRYNWGRGGVKSKAIRWIIKVMRMERQYIIPRMLQHQLFYGLSEGVQYKI